MSYESTIGWRYLYKRPQARGTIVAFFLLTLLGTTILSMFMWVLTKQPTPILVIGFVFVAVAMIVFGLLSIFSVFTTVSVFGVVLGVAALILTLSVTSGFQSAFQNKVLGVNAHVLVTRPASVFENYAEIEDLALSLKPDVVAVQPFVFVEMLATRGKGELSGVAMKGVDPDRVGKVLDLPQHITEGSIDVLKEPKVGKNPPIVIGRELSKKLNAQMGDEITLVLPNLTIDDLKRDARQAHPPKTRKFTVGAIFYSGFDEYDRRLVYINIKEAQDFLGQGDIVMGVEMKLLDVTRAREVARELRERMPRGNYNVEDWRALNKNLFTALTLQKVALLVFLTLIIIVAAFNMVASLTMMVVDKTKEIAILKSMGASSHGVATIFQVVGMTIGAGGTAFGLALGLVLGSVLQRYSYHLDPKVYMIDTLPVQVIPGEVALVAGITMVVCFLATLYPALKASDLPPVDGLRYD